MKLIAFSSALLMVAGCSSTTGIATPLSNTGVTPPVAAASQEPSTNPDAETHSRGSGLLGLVPDNSPELGSDDVADAEIESFATIPPGLGLFDVATRVALTAFNTAEWPVIVADDLDPDYAAFLASSPRDPSDNEPADLLLIVVSPSVGDPNTLFVAFDEIAGDQYIRHVTAIEFDNVNADRPLVVDVAPVS